MSDLVPVQPIGGATKKSKRTLFSILLLNGISHIRQLGINHYRQLSPLLPWRVITCDSLVNQGWHLASSHFKIALLIRWKLVGSLMWRVNGLLSPTSGGQLNERKFLRLANEGLGEIKTQWPRHCMNQSASRRFWWLKL